MLKKSNTKVMILALAVAGMLGVIFLVTIMKSTPEKTLVQFTKAYEKGDQGKIKKLLSPENRKIVDGLWSLMGDSILKEDSDTKKKVIVDDVVYGGDKVSAEVSYYTTTEDSEGTDNEYNTISMIKIKRKWYVDDAF